MTSLVSYTDVRLRKCFPYFKDLPHETKLDYNYHGKKLHWLLLAEVVADISLVRPGFVLRDKSGATFSIHFYPERTEQLTNFAKKIKKGSTLAILYAENHQFMDGQVGIRVEDLRNVKLIRAPLKEILTFNDMLQDLQKVQKPSCSACKTVDAKLQCAGCNLLHYCNQECQTEGWKNKGHSIHCIRLAKDPDVMKLFSMRWDKWSQEDRKFPLTDQQAHW